MHAATDITELCHSVQASILLFIAVGNRHPNIAHPTQLQISLCTVMGIIIHSCSHKLTKLQASYCKQNDILSY
jgi:hypothetical protein